MYVWTVKNEGKLGAYALKRVAAGAHLPTPRLFEPAKRPDDRADYCLQWKGRGELLTAIQTGCVANEMPKTLFHVTVLQ